MPQNLASVAFSTEERDQLRASMETLKQILYPKLVSLDSDGRRELLKMGGKSETFCRQTLELLGKNRKLVPEGYDLDGALADVEALDVLRPMLAELLQLAERMQDTEMALRSDIMVASVEGFSLLKLLGKLQGLDGQLKELATRFRRGRSKAAEPVVA
jgi:hypothetical protein